MEWKHILHNLLITALFTALICLPLHISKAEVPDDQALADAVEDRIETDQVVPISRIRVHVMGGIVTIFGTVDNLLAKHHVEALAETVPGVLEVKDEIKVNPAQRSNSDLIKDLSKALKQNYALRNCNINATAKNSVVTLSGVAHSWRESDLADKIAESVRGIKEIRNEVAIRLDNERPDQEIKKEVEEALKYDALIAPSAISVEAKNGKVTLHGTVGSAAAKKRARTLAWVTGVRDVYAAPIKVVTEGKYPPIVRQKDSGQDTEIQKAVMGALRRDPRTSDFAVVVNVNNGGVVTLRGVVETLEAKRASEEDAQNTLGVLAVKNRLKVVPSSTFRDEQLAEDVRQALNANPYVHGLTIKVVVSDGIVLLRGTVDTNIERATADFTASRIIGVVDVIDRMVTLDSGL